MTNISMNNDGTSRLSLRLAAKPLTTVGHDKAGLDRLRHEENSFRKNGKRWGSESWAGRPAD